MLSRSFFPALGRRRLPDSSLSPGAKGRELSRARVSARLVPTLFRAANRMADALGILRRPLSPTALIELAQRHTGLKDFGDRSFLEPLDVLTKSYEEEANLNAFGRLAARWDSVRFLSNLLTLHDRERKTPPILDEAIDRPMFITGLPRSGSTFLHALLSEDPSNLAVRSWETIFPCPAPDGQSGSAEHCRRQVDRQLATFAMLAPELRDLHPLGAALPQECTEITGHVFRSLRFDTTHHVPSYRHWLDKAGHRDAYRFHKRFLQHLQYRKGRGRWILKCPDHVFALGAIRDTYPDAHFVYLHRDPLEVLASVARLTEALRRPFARRVDRGQIGQQVSERWAQGTALLIEEAERARAFSDGVVHVSFRSFVQDPLRCVAHLYESLGLVLGPEVERRVRRVVAERPDGGYGRKKARLEDYGLDAETERRRYRDYIVYFGL
jgi:hypothetical protein